MRYFWDEDECSRRLDEQQELCEAILLEQEHLHKKQLDRLQEHYEEQITHVRNDLVNKIDHYLSSKSAEFYKALWFNDSDAIRKIANQAKGIGVNTQPQQQPPGN